MNQSDKEFIQWWEKNRESERAWSRFLSKGVGMGLVFSFPIILAVLFRGWYKRMPFVSGTQLFLIIAASLLVSVFYAFLKGWMEWEKNEEKYLSLQGKNQKTED